MQEIYLQGACTHSLHIMCTVVQTKHLTAGQELFHVLTISLMLSLFSVSQIIKFHPKHVKNIINTLFNSATAGPKPGYKKRGGVSKTRAKGLGSQKSTGFIVMGMGVHPKLEKN